jgi:hypothetical protein
MIIDNAINKFIEDRLVAENAARDKDHESSGKLSASMLYQPLRFQVLKTIGAPRKAMEPYVLGKFKRGNDVEDWYVEQLGLMGALVERQKKVEYREVIGFVDAVVDSNKMQFRQGLMPHEVKSVTNAKLRQIAKSQGVDWHYKIQATLYALAMGTEFYAVDIVSAEDLRPNVYIFQTAELKHEVDKIISAYKEAMENWAKDRTLPKFAPNPHVAWTANLQYAMFDPEWATESDSWAIKQLEALGIV